MNFKNSRERLAFILGFWQILIYINVFLFLSSLDTAYQIHKAIMWNWSKLFCICSSCFKINVYPICLIVFLDFVIFFPIALFGYYSNAQLRLDFIEFKP